LINLTKHHNSRKLRLGVVRDRRVKDEDAYILTTSAQLNPFPYTQLDNLTHIATRLGGHIFVGFYNEHFDMCVLCLTGWLMVRDASRSCAWELSGVEG
jgi:hypothetical protein